MGLWEVFTKRCQRQDLKEEERKEAKCLAGALSSEIALLENESMKQKSEALGRY